MLAASAARTTPATAATVAALLAAEADREFRPVTITRRAAAIAAAHRAQDHPNPCDSGAVAAVLSGIRRTHDPSLPWIKDILHIRFAP